MATANPNRVQAHKIPIRFNPFAADGSKPPALIRAFLGDFLIPYSMLQNKEFQYQNNAWEIVLESPFQILASTAHNPMDCLVSFQEWKIQLKDTMTDAEPIARIAIIRQRKDR